MTTITTKIRDWKPGESTKPAEFQPEWERMMIAIIEDHVRASLKGKGIEPVTITTKLGVGFTVLSPVPEPKGDTKP